MGNYKNRTIAIYIFTFLLPYIAEYNTISAQSTGTEKKWNFLTDVYALFPYMDGEAEIGNSLSIPVSANPGDIISKLQMGAMLYIEAKTDKWAISSDLVYMKLNQEATPGIILHSGSLTMKQMVWETAGFYRLAPFFEIGAGGRLNLMQTSFDGRINVLPAGTEAVFGRHTKTWYDPIIIVRLTKDIKDKWLFQFRGDVGGFGIGSHFTWQVQAYAGYRFSKLFQLSVGYRNLATNYSSGEESPKFLVNLNEFGPSIRFGFNF